MLVVLVLVLLFAQGAATPQQPDVQTRMQFYNRALGVECTHCHVEDKWTDAAKPQFATAANMAKMVAAVNEQLGAKDRVSCWTCHAGANTPAAPHAVPPAKCAPLRILYR